MKSVKYILLTLLSVVMCCCESAKREKTDVEKAGLKGNVKTLVEYQAVINSGDLIQGFMTSKTEFDEMGNQTCVSMYDEEGNMVQKRLSKYDGNNRKELTEVRGASDALVRSIVYHYDEKGNVDECQDFNLNGILMYRAINRYDSLGNLIENRIETSDGKFVSKTTMAYDKQGNDTLLCTYEDEEKISQRESRSYDAKGNVVDLCVYNSLNMLLMRENYTYDKRGNMSTSHSFAAAAGLESGKIFQYENFDKHGNYLKGKLLTMDSTLVGGTIRSIEYY